MCAMCPGWGYGMKLYPGIPEKGKGIPAMPTICGDACCIPGGQPNNWYPAGMLMFLSKKKFPNPVGEAGILTPWALVFEWHSLWFACSLYRPCGISGRCQGGWLTAVLQSSGLSHELNPFKGEFRLFLLTASKSLQTKDAYLVLIRTEEHKIAGKHLKFTF